MLTSFPCDFGHWEDNLDGGAPIAAADLHKAAKIRHSFANSAQAHACRSALITTFLCRRRHAPALIFYLEPYLLIAKRQGDAGRGAIGVAMHVRQALLYDAKKAELHF